MKQFFVLFALAFVSFSATAQKDLLSKELGSVAVAPESVLGKNLKHTLVLTDSSTIAIYDGREKIGEVKVTPKYAKALNAKLAEASLHKITAQILELQAKRDSIMQARGESEKTPTDSSSLRGRLSAALHAADRIDGNRVVSNAQAYINKLRAKQLISEDDMRITDKLTIVGERSEEYTVLSATRTVRSRASNHEKSFTGYELRLRDTKGELDTATLKLYDSLDTLVKATFRKSGGDALTVYLNPFDKNGISFSASVVEDELKGSYKDYKIAGVMLRQDSKREDVAVGRTIQTNRFPEDEEADAQKILENLASDMESVHMIQVDEQKDGREVTDVYNVLRSTITYQDEYQVICSYKLKRKNNSRVWATLTINKTGDVYALPTKLQVGKDNPITGVLSPFDSVGLALATLTGFYVGERLVPTSGTISLQK